jgi:hypothetical protein
LWTGCHFVSAVNQKQGADMTFDLKAHALEIQKIDQAGRITISLTPAHILQYRDEVLEEAAKVAETPPLPVMGEIAERFWLTQGDERRARDIAQRIRALKNKEPENDK